MICTGGFTGAGLIRALLGNLPRYPATLPGTIPVQHETGVSSAVLALTLLRALANGGSSLTGREAISNGVSIFRPPASVNARKALAIMAATLGFLVAGVSLLAHMTHATPYRTGYPSVVAQEAQAVLGGGPLSHAGFLLVQAATALILYTGANTSFNGSGTWLRAWVSKSAVRGSL